MSLLHALLHRLERTLPRGLRDRLAAWRTAPDQVPPEGFDGAAPSAPVCRMSERREVPALFDPTFYGEVHPDLAGMDAATLAVHYRNHGRSEARPSSRFAVREGLLTLVPPDADALEIGPFTSPVLRGPKVRYFDVQDRSGLMERGRAIGNAVDDTPEIDFISPVGDLSVVDACFEAVVSSHSIEHQPDLVAHLRHVERLLRPGGAYYLIVPDKRYCFDCFLAESALEDVVAAHVSGHRVHTLQSVVQHRAFTTHNEPPRHWAGDHGELTNVKARAEAAREEWIASAGAYIDIHAWQFTPSSFERVISGLVEHGYTSLRPVRVFETPHRRFEFCAILSR